jgi:hypothetical protein
MGAIYVDELLPLQEHVSMSVSYYYGDYLSTNKQTFTALYLGVYHSKGGTHMGAYDGG